MKLYYLYYNYTLSRDDRFKEKDTVVEIVKLMRKNALFKHRTGGGGHHSFINVLDISDEHSIHRIKHGGFEFVELDTIEKFSKYHKRLFPEMMIKGEKIFCVESKIGFVIGAKGWKIKILQTIFKKRFKIVPAFETTIRDSNLEFFYSKDPSIPNHPKKVIYYYPIHKLNRGD